jgi:hypothetical protein
MWVDAVKNGKKIILTTDQDLIKDGVQDIDDDFLEWFVKNPSCEKVEVKCYSKFNDGDFTDYKIIIPKEEPKQETLEEFAERLCPNKQVEYDMILEGAKWQKEKDKKLYSEEEVKNKCVAGCKHFYGGELKHHKDCFYYPESLSKMYDNLEWQQEQDKNKYSEEDMKKAFQAGKNNNQWSFSCPDFKEWFEQFKKK